MPKNILIIGSGGREHALVLGLKKSPNAGKIYALPGNAGINQDAIGVSIDVSDFQAITEFCKENYIDFVVVGPEQPLVDGIADHLEAEGGDVFGPNKKASEIEGSKDFMKELAVKSGVPTAEYKSFTDEASALDYIDQKGAPIVIKTDGLAAGKGVTVAFTKEEAQEAIKQAFGGKFGAAGSKVVIEEYLEGEEASFFVILDGNTALQIGSAQDHKTAYDGDTGPNTGGMGTYSPAPVVTDDISKKIMDQIINPTMEGFKKEGITYKGFLFAGLMIDKSGNPKLIEYNIRFGDPEAQVLIPRIENDLVELIEKAIAGNLSEVGEIKLSSQSALCVVMAAKGYPASYEKGLKIDLDPVSALPDILIYHAGTKLDDNGQLISSGGRVLGVTGFGDDLQKAHDAAYRAVTSIKFENSHYRTDIGYKGLEAIRKAG